MSEDRYSRRRYKVIIKGANGVTQVDWNDHATTVGTLDAMAKALPVMGRGETWTIERIADEQADTT